METKEELFNQDELNAGKVWEQSDQYLAMTELKRQADEGYLN